MSAAPGTNASALSATAADRPIGPVDRSRRRAVAACALPLAGLAGPLRAAPPPDRLRVVIPYPPGGSTDIVGRLFASQAGKLLGRNVVPDNRAGAAGLIGIQEVLRAAPDGATLGISGIGVSVLIALTKKDVPYVFERDLAPIAHLGSFGNVLLGRADTPYKTLAELIAFAKGRQHALTCGTSTLGSPSHMTLEYLRTNAGLNSIGVPYKGDTLILADLLGRSLDLGIISVPQSIELLHDSRLRAYAVTSARRSPKLPDLPTVAESGFPGFEASLWNVLVARSGTPPDWLQALNEATNKAFATDEARRQLDTQSIQFEPLSIDRTREFLAAEQAKWRRIVQQARIEPT